jgi:hypothetical protein
MTLFRVIDTILFKSDWIHRYPELAARGEGVMAILDPKQIHEAPEVQGRAVVMHRPDGSTAQAIPSAAEAHHSVVGIFFSGASSEEVPKGAVLEW